MKAPPPIRPGQFGSLGKATVPMGEEDDDERTRKRRRSRPRRRRTRTK